jgi:SAM-dependent methyltransferase
MTSIGWDHPDTARYYEAFCGSHDRYRAANRALAANASIQPGLAILDVAAGTGRTAEAILPWLGPGGRIICLERAAAMRAVGERRLRDPRVQWVDDDPCDPAQFDRIVCGAAIWQLLPLETTLERWTRLLAPEGAICFNIPALYLGHPDPAGGGADPWLLELGARIARGCSEPTDPSEPLPTEDAIDAQLRETGLFVTRWSDRIRLCQAAYRDWLKVPPVTSGWLRELTADQRATRIDEAYRTVDPASWRWETWLGWTAWKP